MDPKTTWRAQRREWERRIEDVLVEVVGYRTPDGFVIHSDILPVVRAFDALMDGMWEAQESGKLNIRLGDKDHP